MNAKRRKVDCENRQFSSEWTDLYCFTLPNRHGALPVCLICQQTVAIIKSSNVKRHYETKHKSFAETYPVGSNVRKSKIATLLSNYSAGTEVMSRSMTEQEKCSEASLCISWILGKHMKPFTDADIVKECLLGVSGILFEKKKDVIDTLKRVPVSASTNTRNTHVLADQNENKIKDDLKATPYYALALDESCDITDNAQVLVFVRYFDAKEECFLEELLAMATLEQNTRGEDLYQAFSEVIETYELDLNKLLAVTTDGAPAMISPNKGLVQRLKSTNPALLSYHCIIHQSVLCCKLHSELQTVMQRVINIVNFIRAKSSLSHRMFKSLLDEVDAEYDDLLLHNNVRWLSKGAVLQRFYKLLVEIKEFLIKSKHPSAQEHMEFLDCNSNVTTIAFLTDLFEHLNVLNKKLQGKGKLVTELISEIRIFSKKLEIFLTDLTNEMLHFPNLKDFVKNNNEADCNNFVAIITDLLADFKNRFQDFSKITDVAQVVTNAFSLEPNGIWTSEAEMAFGSKKGPLQMEAIELHEDASLKEIFKQVPSDISYEQFWCKYVSRNKYPELQKLAMKLCTLFGSTYTCESAFSKMNFIKNKFRSRLTNEHLKDLMRIACTSFNPDLKKIVKLKTCHFSH